MDKVELYRQVYFRFKELCAEGKQPCSFHTYCKKYGVDQSQMPMVLKDEYVSVTKLPGYVRDGGKALIWYNHPFFCYMFIGLPTLYGL